MLYSLNMPSIDARTLRTAGRLFRKTQFSAKVPIKAVRANYESLLATSILPNNIDRQEVDSGSVPADLLVPELAIGERTILYAHGGGFIAGSRKASANLCASIAHESASRLLLPEYRLAPEYPYPTALEDLYHAYSWLLRKGVSSEDIIFAGDGSGANLALALAHYLKTKSVALPRAIVAISPWVDLTCSSPAFQARKSADPIHTREALFAQALQYTWQDNFKNPHVSPLFGDFSDYPALYIQCGSEELLLDDARALAKSARASGVETTLDVRDGMWHLFQAIDSLTPEAHRAVKSIGGWVRSLYRY